MPTLRNKAPIQRNIILFLVLVSVVGVGKRMVVYLVLFFQIMLCSCIKCALFSDTLLFEHGLTQCGKDLQHYLRQMAILSNVVERENH